MSSLYPTPARLALLDLVTSGQIIRDAAGDDRVIDGARKVSAQIADLEKAGWVTLTAKRWQATPTGEAHQQLRICNYGTHAVAETGPETDPRVIGQAIRRSPSGPGSWWVQVGDGQAACRNADSAVAELRRRAVELLAAELTSEES